MRTLNLPHHLILLAIFLATPTHSTPIPLSFEDWLQGQLFPAKGTDLEGEITCYSLPYGGLGFLSHVLTYYAVTTLCLGLRPLMPWKKLEHNSLDLVLNVIGLLVSTMVAAFAMSACRHRWQFVCLATWRLTTSLTLSLTGLAQAHHLRKKREARARFSTIVWLGLYFSGMVVGMAGLLSVVASSIRENFEVRLISIVFGVVCLLPVVATLGFCCSACISGTYVDEDGLHWTWTALSLPGVLLLFSMLAAFYADWILAAIARKDWEGMPSSDNAALYWTYFVAKRLPLLSL